MFIPICREQVDLFEQEFRCQKAAMNFFKMCYAFVITIWCYTNLRDKTYFPSALGGSGEFLNTLKDYPFQKHDTFIAKTLLVQMGYHMSQLIFHFLDTRKNDFIEMGLHHTVALFLFIGAFVINMHEVAIVIAFLHDLADIFTRLTKTLTETIYDHWTVNIFIFLMGIWFYTRIIVFGSIVL
jgi:hypothetical protein